MCVGNVGVALFLIWFSIACIEPSVVATIVPNNPSTLDTLRIQLSGDHTDSQTSISDTISQWDGVQHCQYIGTYAIL